MIHKLLAIGSAAAVLAVVGTASADGSGAAPSASVSPPMVGFDVGVGVLGYLDGETPAGPAWQARIRGIVVPELSVEGTYLGSVSQRSDNEQWMVSSQVDGGLRFSPLAGFVLPVQPYGSAGVGYAHFSGRDGDDGALVLPLRIGAEAPLSRNVKMGTEVGIRPVFMEDLSTAAERSAGMSGPGGDSWTVLATLGGAF